MRAPGGGVAFEAAERELRYGGGLLAGGIAYRLFLWIVPLALVLATLLGFWFEADPRGPAHAAKEFGLGAASVAEANDALEARTGSRVALLFVGVLLVAWFTLGAVRALRLAYALAWGIERPRLRRPLHAVAIFNALIILSALSFLTLTWLREVLGLGALLGALMLVAVQTAVALAAFRLLPRRTDRWEDLLPGALLAAVGIELLHVAVAVYFAPKLERSSALYGVLGTATVILVWLYVIARLLTSAAFLNATLWERRQREAAGDLSDG